MIPYFLVYIAVLLCSVSRLTHPPPHHCRELEQEKQRLAEMELNQKELELKVNN